MNSVHDGEKAKPVGCPWCGGMFSNIWRHISTTHPSEISQFVNVCRLCRQEVTPTSSLVKGSGNSSRNQEDEKEETERSSKKMKEATKRNGCRKRAGSSLEKHFNEEHGDGKCRFCKRMVMKFTWRRVSGRGGRADVGRAAPRGPSS